jgi:hypothetical protein
MTKKAKKKKSPSKRLRPGELDGLVLAHLRKHKGDGPLTVSAIAKNIGRSSGAVTNCLGRLAEANLVRMAKKSPRAFLIKEGAGR